MKFFAFALSLLLMNYAKCQKNQCYQLTKNPYSLFASKSAYSSLSANQNYTNQSKLHVFIYTSSKTNLKGFWGPLKNSILSGKSYQGKNNKNIYVRN
jgi:hypothetical protein